MTESEFNRQIDATLLAIEEAADASDADIDYENSGGVLTLALGNGSQVIINRQTPVRQLWVAARSGGFHFDFDAASGAWRRDSDGAELFAVLSSVLTEQGGEAVTLCAG
ncbi:MAG TPA: iron donor protein CyaY [Gammaproteobacteria bacterium]